MKVFDLHCDTLSELRYAEKAGTPKSFAQNDLHIDLQKLKKGDYMLQCFAAFVNLGDKTPGADPLVTALEEIDVFKRIMEKYPEDIAPVYQPSDIRKNAAEGKISGMLTIEEGGCCKGSIGVLRRMYELGVRMMTLTWNHENELASPNVVPGGGHNIWPCAPNTETGLKEKGFEFLAEMERLHIIADVSHLSDKGFWDIVEHSTRPFAASHSNCRALAPHCRNLTDEMIRALANKGGLVGLNYCSGFLDNQPEEKLCRSTTALMAKHAAHFKQVGGIEIIGLGSDFDGIGGDVQLLRSVEMIDQNPIGKSSRSNPVTYIKAYDEIRKLFADQPYAQHTGLGASSFSFNIAGGRCEECQGEGVIKVSMQFMADVELVCEACGGKRFRDEILEVKYRGKSIYDVLEMTVDDAIAFFGEDKKDPTCKRIVERLKPLQDVGLGYIKLGQSSSTLSGGESQRVKLASFLTKDSAQGGVMFIFDEPTTGLHFHDINKLLAAFNALIERGHTIVIVEHNMDVIKCADWVVDLGPEAGTGGGRVVFEGTPRNLEQCPASYTGKYLRLRTKL